MTYSMFSYRELAKRGGRVVTIRGTMGRHAMINEKDCGV